MIIMVFIAEAPPIAEIVETTDEELAPQRPRGMRKVVTPTNVFPLRQQLDKLDRWVARGRR